MKRIVKEDDNFAKGKTCACYMDVCIPYLRLTTGEDGFATEQSLDEACDFGEGEDILDFDSLPVEKYSVVRQNVREFLSGLKLSPCATYKVEGEFRINYVETMYRKTGFLYPANKYIDPDTIRVTSYDFNGLEFNRIG